MTPFMCVHNNNNAHILRNQQKSNSNFYTLIRMGNLFALSSQFRVK